MFIQDLILLHNTVPFEAQIFVLELPVFVKNVSYDKKARTLSLVWQTIFLLTALSGKTYFSA